MKKLAIVLIIILILAIPTAVYFTIKSSTDTNVHLTEREEQYLQRISPIKIAVDPDWEPFEKLDEEGNYTGIAADYVKLLEKRLNIQFEIVPTKDWEQSLKYSKEGKVTILPFLNKTAEREKWLIFTEPLVMDDNVIIGRYDTPYVQDLALEKNKKVALPEGTSVEERLRQDYPNLTIVITKTEDEAFELVSKGKVDFTIRSMLIGSYSIRKQGWFDLKVIGQVPNYTNYLRMGIAKDQVLLQAILDKAILSITEQERVDILNKHVPIRVEIPNDYKKIQEFLMITIALASIFLLIIALQSSRAKALKRKNEEIQTITERYEALSQLAGTYFWQLDGEGIYTYVSAEVKQVLGYEVAELLGKNYLTIHLPSDDHSEIEQYIDFFHSGNTFKSMEVLYTRRDGTQIWVELNAMPIWDENGQLLGYRGNSTNIQGRKQLEEALIQAKEEMELAYYQAQIGPHFLYNALNAIAVYCLTEPKQASKLIIDLSFFLRRSFDFKSKQRFVTWEQELELIKAYVSIERARFQERLTVEYDLNHVSSTVLLPPLILQPIVENAINHGIMKRIEGGRIIIRARQQNEQVTFEISDDGIGISEEYIRSLREDVDVTNLIDSFHTSERHGIGLRNIQSRLKKYYGSELTIYRNEQGGTTVTFTIPAHLKGVSA